MNDNNLRTVMAGLVGALVVVVAATLFVMAGRSGPATSSPTGPAIGSTGASASPAASGDAGPSPSAGVTAPATPAISPIATSSANPSAVASGSAQPTTLATLTFLGLKLDATGAPGSEPRTVTFQSDGPGTITARLATTRPQGTTHMCVRVGSKDIGCKDAASGTFTGKTSQARANWRVTLLGNGTATPTVNLTVTFQAIAPSVKIQHARFDGTAFPDTNGIQVRFTARTAGEARLVANWGGHPFPFEIDLFDETSGTGDKTFPNQAASTNVDQVFPITAGDWRLVLQNVEDGFGTTDLTATISWP